MSGILVPVIVIAVGAAAAALAGWRRRFDRHLSRAPRTRIAEAKANVLVVIAGQVGRVDRPLRAPISGRRCLAYEIIREDGSGGSTGQLLERRAADFFVRDATGKARVLLGQRRDFQLVLERSVVAKRPSELQTAHFDTDVLIRWRAVEYDRLFPDQVVLVERILPIDGRVLVAGHGVWEADPDPDASSVTSGYRDPPRLLLLGADEDHPLVVSDRV